MNMMRGQYIRDWGNTPGHVQHFSRQTLNHLVSKQFNVVATHSPTPWTVLLGRKGSHTL